MSSIVVKKSSRHWVLLLLVLILLLGFALRVYQLDGHNIWGDEAISVWLAKQTIADVLKPGAETNPPLYHLVLRLWEPLAGNSAFAMRYMSVIAGLLTLPLVYNIGRRVSDRRMGSIATIVMALSSFHVYYSQEARMYAWVTFLCTLSIYAFVQVVDQFEQGDEKAWRWLVVYAISTLGALYTHYYAALIVLAQNVYMVLRWRTMRRWLLLWFGIQLGMLLLYLPWNLAQARVLVASQLTNKSTGLRVEAWGTGGLYDVWVRTPIAYGLGTTLLPSMRWLAVIPLLIVLAGVIYAIQKKQWLLLVYLLTPVAGAYLAGPVMPFYWERYLLVGLPAYALLAGMGLSKARSQWIAPVGIALFAALNLYTLNNYFFNPEFLRGRYGDMMAYIGEHATENDAILLENHLQWALYDYYAPEDLAAYRFPLETGWGSDETQAELKAIAASHDQLWLVMFGNPAAYDPAHELENWLSQHAFRAHYKGYGDATLSLYISGSTEPDDAIAANFDNIIKLTAYGLSSTTIAAGDVLEVAVAWEARESMDTDYTIFTHLIDDGETIHAQVDSQPQGGTRPTSTWQAGEDFTDRFALQITPEILPGTYYIQIGWYDWRTLDRLPVLNAEGELTGERVILAKIEVVAP